MHSGLKYGHLGHTDSTKINRPYVLNRIFDSRLFMYNKIFLELKFVVHIFTLLLASFASILVTYSRHSESLNIRKNSEIDDIFLGRQLIVEYQTYFKDSLCLQKLTNLDAKDAKRSVKMWTTNFYKSFPKNMLLYRFNQNKPSRA